MIDLKASPAAQTDPHKCLLTATQVMQSLGVSRATFYGDQKRGLPGLVKRLRAKGLRAVTFPTHSGGKPRKRYTSSSLHKVIEALSLKEPPQ